MAISWKYNISQIGKANNYNVSAEVTDDAKPAESQTETVSLQGKFETPEEKAKVYGWLKDQYAKKIVATDTKVLLETVAKTETEKLFTAEVK